MATGAAGEAFYGGNATALAVADIPCLVVDRTVLLAVAAAARRELPREACGLLGGHRRGSTWQVTAFTPLANLLAEADRFACDPIEFASAEAHLRDRGLQWLGFAHSHPDGITAPSSTDRRDLWRDCVHLIAAVGRDGDDRCAGWLAHTDGSFEPLPLSADSTIDPAATPP